MRFLHVVGSRSGFFRLSPVYRALRATGAEQTVVFAGHRDDLAPHDSFLAELDLPAPDHVLGFRSGSSAMITGRSLIALEPIVSRGAPDWIFAVGDADAALAAALVGRKSGVPTAHLEAGLRTGDDSAPEEVNRLLTDRIADLLLAAGREAEDTLAREGIPAQRVHVVGNVVADAVMRLRDRAVSLDLPAVMGLERSGYLLALFRRSRNVTDEDRLEGILRALDSAALETGRSTVVVMEPAISAAVRRYRLSSLLAPLTVVESTTYSELLGLVEAAAVVITDAGEIQDATTLLGVSCVTVRHALVRQVTVRDGTNHVLRSDAEDLVEVILEGLDRPRRPGRPDLWDGRAAERIVRIASTAVPSGVA